MRTVFAKLAKSRDKNKEPGQLISVAEIDEGVIVSHHWRDNTGSEKDVTFLAVGSIEKLIHHTQSNYIILSYSTGGRATAKELREVIADCATLVKTLAIDYKKNVMADMKWTHQWSADENVNQELLFVLKKR